MSQHYFSTSYQGKPVTVLAGWDRPLQQFFLVIEFVDPDIEMSDEDIYLYSNLNDAHAWQQEWGYFQGKLDELGIAIPESMVGQMLDDCAKNVGNRHCSYNADGSYVCDGVANSGEGRL